MLIHFYLGTDEIVSLPIYLRNLSPVMLFFRFNNETGVKLAGELLTLSSTSHKHIENTAKDL